MTSTPRKRLTPQEQAALREQRSQAHLSTTYQAFLQDLVERGQLSRETAERAAVSVLCVLEQRIMHSEGDHLEAQLPRKLVELLHRCERHEELRRTIDREKFLELVAGDLDLSSVGAEPLVRAVLATVSAHVSPGEIRQVLQQLPEDLRELWPEEVRHPLGNGFSAPAPPG